MCYPLKLVQLFSKTGILLIKFIEFDCFMGFGIQESVPCGGFLQW